MPDPQLSCPQPSSGSKFPASPFARATLPSLSLMRGKVVVGGDLLSFPLPCWHPQWKGRHHPSFYLIKWRPRESSHLSKVTLQIRAPTNLEQEVWPGAVGEPLSCPHILPPTNKRRGLHFHLCFLPPTEVLSVLRNEEMVHIPLVKITEHALESTSRRKRDVLEDFPKIFLLRTPLPQWRELG